jgi:site-specific DNA recombinase
MAAYCRVSTDQAEQLSSYEAQVTYYTNFITGHPDYEMAGIYADEGISGTNTKKREQFLKMIDDCKKGKIDMIITKSISRFARNTLDCLNYVRQLKELGIGILFEKENINTLDSKGEVLLSILSSLAQDESRSISENSQWGIRRRFEQGKLHVNHTKFLGYDKDEDGNLVINKEQAKVVKRIYQEYLNGHGFQRIAKMFKEQKVPKWDGSYNWYYSNIKQILTNEKYKGDALLQKTYTVDFLSKKRAVNDGDVPQYYVENSHPAIIDKDTWEAVQQEMERRREFGEKHGIDKVDHTNDKNPFSGRVICGCCGKAYWRKGWYNYRDESVRYVWQCSEKYKVKGVKGCNNKHVDDGVLYEIFMNAYNSVVQNKDELMKKWHAMSEDENEWKRVTAKRFIDHFKEADEITNFESNLFYKTVEKLTVLDSGKVIVSLLDGTDIECEIE